MLSDENIMYILINAVLFLIITYSIVHRVILYHQFQISDFILLFISLFFPIGLIRPYLGYGSVIGYDQMEYKGLLTEVSFFVFFGVLLFLLGLNLTQSYLRRNFREYGIFFYQSTTISYGINFIKFINLLLVSVVIIKTSIFLNSQVNGIDSYFSHIDSTRQTLTGQMPTFFIIYLSTLTALYVLLAVKRVTVSLIVTYIVVIIAFAVYGFRGPIITVLVMLFLALQKTNLIKFKLNLKWIVIIGVLIFFFYITQVLRDHEVGREPVFIQLLTRFNGYEPLMVIYHKVVHLNHFTFNTFWTTIIEFFELPIPRSIFPDKLEPISILLARDMFFDVGTREFTTGGISPTIFGSLVWNFSVVGIFLMLIFGSASAYVEFLLRYKRSVMTNLLAIVLGIYMVRAVEAPENSFGVLWMTGIGWGVIFIIVQIFKWRFSEKYINN